MKRISNVTKKIFIPGLLLLSMSLTACGGTPAPEAAAPAEEASGATEIVQPTATSVPPTATPLPPTDTPVPPTATPVPPTDTPVPPTDTPIPPTDTPVPPTATATLPADTPTPTGPSAMDHYDQGMIYFDQENYDRAIVEFQEVIRLEPDAAWPYLYLGLSYYFTGTESNEKVIGLLEEFLQLAPEAEERDEVIAFIEQIRAGTAPVLQIQP